MKSIYIVVAIIFIGSGAYFLMDDSSNTSTTSTKNHVFSKGVLAIKGNKPSNESSVAEAATPPPLKKEVKNIKGCEVALTKLELDVDCLEKSIAYAGKKASIVYLKGTEQENSIVLPGERFIPLTTNLYYNPASAIKAYIKRTDLFELTDDDIKDASEELRVGKRGYLYSLKFDKSYIGTIYITPNGRVSGHLKK